MPCISLSRKVLVYTFGLLLCLLWQHKGMKLGCLSQRYPWVNLLCVSVACPLIHVSGQFLQPTAVTKRQVQDGTCVSVHLSMYIYLPVNIRVETYKYTSKLIMVDFLNCDSMKYDSLQLPLFFGLIFRHQSLSVIKVSHVSLVFCTQQVNAHFRM